MAMNHNLIEKMTLSGRQISIAEKDDPRLGPLRWLPGTWKNTEELKGQGFNMIALPFANSPDFGQSENGYRLLINQYNESLNFILVDAGVPNRGVAPPDQAAATQSDQTVVALSYTQIVTQIASEDSFVVSASGQQNSTLSKTNISDKFNDQPIHHEPGLWLYMTNQNISDPSGAEINIARMGSIPHGNSFIAVGSFQDLDPAQRIPIPSINGVVEGGGPNPNERPLDPILRPGTNIIGIDYFGPFRHFNQNPFKGSTAIPGYAGFEPVHATTLLRHTLDNLLSSIGTIKHVTQLSVDSTVDISGINRISNPSIGNTPFIARQADTTAFNATFLIYEIEDKNTGELRYFLQYAQTVMLDFINRPDGHPGRARWPHVSINTMERVRDASPQAIVDSLPSKQE